MLALMQDGGSVQRENIIDPIFVYLSCRSRIKSSMKLFKSCHRSWKTTLRYISCKLLWILPWLLCLALQTILLIINWFSWFYFQSRAALSLLGYCYFQVQSFEAASDWLVKSLELRKRGNPMWYGLGCLLSCFGMSNTDFALAYGVDDRRPWNASWLLHLYCKKTN